MLVMIDYGMGNTGSITNALTRAGIPFIFSAEHADIETADHLLLCGVGAFDSGMQKLHERGLSELLTRKVLEEKTPILGICLGMQLFSRTSEEGSLPGLGWFDADTIRFRQDGTDGKIPHMGWNSVDTVQDHPLLESIENSSVFYFMHSYHLQPDTSVDTVAHTEYGTVFPSIMVKGNIAGVQFHPEKSREQGTALLRNFAEWRV